MASGGYVSSQKSLSKVAREVGSRNEARRLITDALINGSIRARGSTPGEAVPTKAGRLVPIGQEDFEDDGPVEDVAVEFWAPVTNDDVKRWDWVEGYFCSLSCQGSRSAYVVVSFNEKDINAVIKQHRANLRGIAPTAVRKERLRSSSWDNWVAALAILAHERAIKPEMKQNDLLSRVAARLGTWELAEMPVSTVGRTARVVLERFRNNPPTEQLTAQSLKKP